MSNLIVMTMLVLMIKTKTSCLTGNDVMLNIYSTNETEPDSEETKECPLL